MLIDTYNDAAKTKCSFIICSILSYSNCRHFEKVQVQVEGYLVNSLQPNPSSGAPLTKFSYSIVERVYIYMIIFMKVNPKHR